MCVTVAQCRRVDKTKHLILTSPHPSPLSAHRGYVLALTAPFTPLFYAAICICSFLHRCKNFDSCILRLSYNNTRFTDCRFIGNRHFSKCNTYLVQNGRCTLDCTTLVPPFCKRLFPGSRSIGRIKCAGQNEELPNKIFRYLKRTWKELRSQKPARFVLRCRNCTFQGSSLWARFLSIAISCVG